VIPKLRGTFEPPSTGAPVSEATALQKSIFNAPPAAVPTKPVENGVGANAGPHGIKRSREEEEEDENEVSMEEDDDDAPMEEDEDD